LIHGRRDLIGADLGLEGIGEPQTSNFMLGDKEVQELEAFPDREAVRPGHMGEGSPESIGSILRAEFPETICDRSHFLESSLR
jgi:hypothetical protein